MVRVYDRQKNDNWLKYILVFLEGFLYVLTTKICGSHVWKVWYFRWISVLISTLAPLVTKSIDFEGYVIVGRSR